MRRFRATWLAFAVSLAALYGAMGWASATVLRLEGAQRQASAQAAFEERVRLALWRMDSAMTPVVALENARPYFVYSSFYPLERAYTRMFNEIRADEVLVPSPLLAATSEDILLHFQVDPDGTVSSPQVPSAAMKELAESQYISPYQVLAASQRLGELRPLVQRQALLASLGGWLPIPPTLNPPRYLTARPVAAAPLPSPSPSAAPAQVQPQAVGNQKGSNDQLDLNQNEWRARLSINSSGQMAAQQRQDTQINNRGAINLNANSSSQLLGNGTSSGNFVNGNTNVDAYGKLTNNLGSNPSSNNFGGLNSIAGNGGAASGVTYVAGFNLWETASLGAGNPKSPTDQSVTPPSVQQTELRPVWSGTSLLLVRRVTAGGQSYLQGCWLNWPQIRSWLLGMVTDLLPQADLSPLVGADSERAMASLPVRLLPGPPPAGDPGKLSPIMLSLAFAWAAVLAASGGAAWLLRGALSLSERRGAFVSAVTHELRTPLTTFRLYSEMLAGGMVTGDDQRRKYLTTLVEQSGRLSHLVENVLAYARLERNRNGTNAETVELVPLLTAACERLCERANADDMQVVLDRSTPSAGEASESDAVGDDVAPSSSATGAAAGPSILVRVNVAALEQILLNLVDNACKYACPQGDRRIEIGWSLAPGVAIVSVRDHGGGVPRAFVRRLFEPFHKSAREAATSAPGIGLGLTLSRRLARAMNGDLRLDPACTDGARFLLTLPRA